MKKIGTTQHQVVGRSKRVFDVVVALTLIIVACPIIVALSVVLGLSLRTWPFFSQTRIGEHGQEFNFLKLRTLPRSAPAYADKYEIGMIDIPWIARILRASHLDELPQLFLVLTGKMSLVGPRPEMPHLHREFASSHQMAREAVKPGCTGIWQVSIDNSRLIHEAPGYDLFYVEHASLRLDLWILYRTVLLVVGGPRIVIGDTPSWALTPAAARDLVVAESLPSSLAA